jgi:hypothetical protein
MNIQKTSAGSSQNKAPRSHRGANRRHQVSAAIEQKLLFVIPRRIFRGELLPLFWKIFQRENRCHWANRNASAAVDAFNRIDVQHRLRIMLGLVFARVDTVHGTNIYARTIFRIDTRFGDYISHAKSPSRGSEPGLQLNPSAQSAKYFTTASAHHNHGSI